MCLDQCEDSGALYPAAERRFAVADQTDILPPTVCTQTEPLADQVMSVGTRDREACLQRPAEPRRMSDGLDLEWG